MTDRAIVPIASSVQAVRNTPYIFTICGSPMRIPWRYIAKRTTVPRPAKHKNIPPPTSPK